MPSPQIYIVDSLRRRQPAKRFANDLQICVRLLLSGSISSLPTFAHAHARTRTRTRTRTRPHSRYKSKLLTHYGDVSQKRFGLCQPAKRFANLRTAFTFGKPLKPLPLSFAHSLAAHSAAQTHSRIAA